jgi:1,4-dihydroxy-6-naphthoate synthase
MTKKITIAHSPDSDDAYMMAPLALGWLKDDQDFQRFSLEFVRRDIETLNQEALEAKHDVTAISFGAYPKIQDKYNLLRAGSSIQEGTGPIIVAKQPISPESLRSVTVVVPGLMTSAYLAMCRWMPGLKAETMPFDKIMDEVASGRVGAGLLIHEGQLMYKGRGLCLVVDLGEWWKGAFGLPLPMGGNAIKKDMPPEEARAFARLMQKSVKTAMERHQESIDYAQSFARGMDRETVDRYVKAWVNNFTLDVGSRGAQAVEALLGMAVDWVGP